MLLQRKRRSRGCGQQGTKMALETSSLGRSKTSERSVPGNGGTGVPLAINRNTFLSRLGQVMRENICFL